MSSGLRQVRKPRSRLACFAFLGAMAGAGCGGGGGDNLPRQAVSGSVTFEGTPVSHGFIQFRPVDTGPTAEAGGEIKDGKYAIPREQGPVAGGYRVSITSTEATASGTTGGMPGEAGPGARELIPAKYNVASTLDREIKEGGPNTLDFELKK
jgi:hypothetical protein